MPAISLRLRTEPPPRKRRGACFPRCAGSRRVTAETAEHAICSHGDPPDDGPDLATVEAAYSEPAGEALWGSANTQTPPPAIEMVNEGAEKLSCDPEQRHDRLP